MRYFKNALLLIILILLWPGTGWLRHHANHCVVGGGLGEDGEGQRRAGGGAQEEDAAGGGGGGAPPPKSWAAAVVGIITVTRTARSTARSVRRRTERMSYPPIPVRGSHTGAIGIW